MKIEQALYRHYLERRGAPPSLLLYDVTSSYFEGLHNALGEYGYNRDGKRGKKQIVIGLLADDQGEPLAVRVFAGNRNDPTTVPDQIRIVKEQFGVEELVFVGDRGMVKSKGKQALGEAGLRYITALTDPQIRRRLRKGCCNWSCSLNKSARSKPTACAMCCASTSPKPNGNGSGSRTSWPSWEASSTDATRKSRPLPVASPRPDCASSSPGWRVTS